MRDFDVFEYDDVALRRAAVLASMANPEVLSVQSAYDDISGYISELLMDTSGEVRTISTAGYTIVFRPDDVTETGDEIEILLNVTTFYADGGCFEGPVVAELAGIGPAPNAAEED